MSVRKLKPITPGQRFRVVNEFDAITTDKPEKSLLVPYKKSGGRNNSGKMTMRYMGGVINKNIVLSISKEKKIIFPLPLNLLNTIRIELRLSRWFIMLMVKKDIS